MAETYINAQDLVEDVSLDGEEQFVMFDTEAGRRAKLKNIKEYINDQEYAKQASTAGEAVVATQLLGDDFRKDTALYTVRKTGGGKSVDKAEIIDKITGGTVAFNQQLNAGDQTTENNGVTFTVSNGIVHCSGTCSGYVSRLEIITTFTLNHVYCLLGCPQGGGVNAYIVDTSAGIGYDTGNGIIGKTANSTGTGNMAIVIYQGVNASNLVFMPQLFDLTQMFGTAVADYIYSLEQSSAGAGVAFFKSLFPSSYYSYNAGELMSVNASEHVTTGFNLWDEEWRRGYYNSSTGEYTYHEGFLANKNPIPVPSGETFYFKAPVTMEILEYDASMAFVNRIAGIQNGTFIASPDTAFINFSSYSQNALTTYKNDICINLSGDRNGEYEPSKHNHYSLDSSLALRGVPKIVDGKLTYDGDEYFPSGRVNRKVGLLDYATDTVYVAKNSGVDDDGDWLYFMNVPSGSSTDYTVLSDKFYTANSIPTTTDKAGGTFYSASYHVIYVNMYGLVGSNNSTAVNSWFAQNKPKFVYPLATPTTESAKPYTSVQACSPEGIEEFVYLDGNVNIPVMAETRYPIDRATRADEATVLAADQLRSNSYTEESVPYKFRKAGGDVIAGGVKDECIVGGTVAWNQLVQNGNFATAGSWGGRNGNVSVSNSIATFTATQSDTYSGLMASSGAGFANPSHKYLFLADIMPSISATIEFSFGGGGVATARADVSANVWNSCGAVWIPPSDIYPLQFCALAITGVNSGETIKYKNCMGFDLTQMFGSTIADYIYNLEQSSAGAGVALFKSMFPEAYYEYNAGELVSVSGLQKHATVGFNAWDEEWENGYVDDSGNNSSFDIAYIRPKNYIKVVPSTNYNFSHRHNGKVLWYNSSKEVISINDKDSPSNVLKSPADACYMRFWFWSANRDYYTYNHDIYINITDTDRNGTYEPYEKHSYALDSSLVLRGVLKLVSNKVCFDGDEYRADGSVTRRYGVMTFNGNQSWSTNGDRGVYKSISQISPKPKAFGRMFSSKYVTLGAGEAPEASGYMNFNSAGDAIHIRDANAMTGEAFIQMLASNPLTLIYELHTPATETADAYVGTQVCDEYGTEEYISTSICPVGHKTKYYDNLTKRIVDLPSAIAPVERFNIASTNYSVGDYLIMNDKLYKVTSAIASGGKITVGTNVTATTIMAEIKALQ